MGGGAGDEPGTILLETPPYVIALVFVFFLVITLGFEWLLEALRKFLTRKRKFGLLAAMKNMTNEIMLLGFATLILLLLEDKIDDICVPATHYFGHVWLDFVQGCACCLPNTMGVSRCYYEHKGCEDYDVVEECCNTMTGVQLANSTAISDGKVCMNITARPDETDPTVLAAVPGLVTLVNKGYVPKPKSIYTPTCHGGVQVGWEQCHNKDSRPAIGREALHQIHMMIFIMALTHILTGIVIILLSMLRVRWWRRWKKQDDLLARKSLHLRMSSRPSSRASATPKVAPEEGLSAADAAVVDKEPKALETYVSACSTAGVGDASVEELLEQDEEQRHLSSDADTAAAPPLDSLPESKSTPPLSTPPSAFKEAAAAGEPLALPAARPAHAHDVEGGLLQRRPRWTGRPEQLPARGPARWAACCVELWWCMARLATPWVITRTEFMLMRASFFYTHGISSAEVDFMGYILDSLEDDASRVVGLGFGMWAFVIIFILLSSIWGWCIWFFTVLTGAGLLLINLKLVWISRYVTRGGKVQLLTPGVFWLNRPWLLLQVIKLQVFFVSFVFSNTIFFAAFFGPRSCFFSRTGFQNNPIPWWATLVVNCGYLLIIAGSTLPLFSLVVQMGADFKLKLLPPAVHARFTAAAAQRDKGVKLRFGSRIIGRLLHRQLSAKPSFFKGQ